MTDQILIAMNIGMMIVAPEEIRSQFGKSCVFLDFLAAEGDRDSVYVKRVT